MLSNIATHYTRIITDTTLTPFLIEGGKPILVNGMTISSAGDNWVLSIYEGNQTTRFLRIRGQNNRTVEFDKPFIAYNGISIKDTFFTNDTSYLICTIFYSDIGT